MDDNHPDPFQDAIQHGLQQAVQLGSFALTAAQMYIYRQRTQARAAAERDERARRALHAQIRSERDAARAAWAPALDPAWLRQASLIQAAQAWGAAMPYADRAVPWYEPAAVTAMRKSEERLRELHPYAMAYYDRLRADGLGPAEAMYQAAPLFTRHPRAHDAPSTPRPELQTGTSPDVTWTTPADGAGGPGSPAAVDTLERRGRQIAQALQAQARSQGRDPLGPDELHTVLETVTNVPAHVIDRIARPGAADGLARAEQDRAATAERVRAADLDAASDLKATPGLDERTTNLTGARDAAATASAATARASRATRPWERDFPMPIRDVVAATSRAANAGASAAAISRTPATQPARRAGPRP
jgi:hypothetical protein